MFWVILYYRVSKKTLTYCTSLINHSSSFSIYKWNDSFFSHPTDDWSLSDMDIQMCHARKLCNCIGTQLTSFVALFTFWHCKGEAFPLIDDKKIVKYLLIVRELNILGIWIALVCPWMENKQHLSFTTMIHTWKRSLIGDRVIYI